MLRASLYTFAVCIAATFVPGCMTDSGYDRGTVAKLEKLAGSENSHSRKVEASASQVKLELKRESDDTFSITLVNTGAQPITVIRPAHRQTIRIMFFDSSGNLLDPEIAMAIGLPRMSNLDIHALPAGDSLSTDIFRSAIAKEFSDLSGVSYIIAVYHPSDHAIDSVSSSSQLDLMKSSIWSGPVKW